MFTVIILCHKLYLSLEMYFMFIILFLSRTTVCW